MKTKLENQLMENIMASSKYYLPENAYFLGQRYMELSKDENLNQIIPIFLHLKKFNYLISILKHKKNKLSRYYYAIALFFSNKIEAAKKILDSFLIDEENEKNKCQKTKQASVKNPTLPMGFIYYYLGRIFEIQKKHQEAQEFYKKSFTSDNSLFCAFERFVKSKNRTEFGHVPVDNNDIIFFHPESLQNTAVEKTLDFPMVNNSEKKSFNSKLNANDLNFTNLIESDFKIFKKKNKENKSKVENFFIEKNTSSNKELSDLLTSYYIPYKYQLNSKYEKAFKEYQRIKKTYQNSSFFLNNIGICLIKMVKYEEALVYFQKARKSDKSQLEGVEYYSTCLWHLNKTNELLELSENLFKNYPENAQTWLVLGNSYSALKDHTTAIKFFKRSIQIDPYSSYSYCLLGHEYIFLEDYDLAKQSYFSAIGLNNLEFTGYWGLGNVFLKTDKYEQAFRYFLIALSLNPNCAIIYTYIGITLINQEKYEQALKIFEKSQKYDPLNLMNTYYKATALYFLKNYETALNELEKIKSSPMKEARVYLLIGKIYKKLGKKNRAHENFLIALDYDPRDSEKKIRNLIDRLNLEEGDINKENFKTPNS